MPSKEFTLIADFCPICQFFHYEQWHGDAAAPFDVPVGLIGPSDVSVLTDAAAPFDDQEDFEDGEYSDDEPLEFSKSTAGLNK